ncbi:asparagine synthase-related protein [Actinosynnema sp. CS-041913]|uniref:asparagine synthase-related protein n=1 Tax=Actinosynnema sp. CS-041913 TaxID=3239917 RepID=UPI003D8D3DB3
MSTPRPTVPGNPGVLGVHPPNRAAFPLATTSPTSTALSTATEVWPDRSSPVSWGTWRPGEFRTAECPEGRLLVVGNCLADDARMRADLSAALRGNRPELVTGWPGSYLAVVLTGHELVAFVDLAGQHPLYFHPGGPTVYGTSPGRTAAAAGLGSHLDPHVALADIFCAAVPGLTRNRAPIAGLRKVEAGEALHVSAAGSVTIRAYEPDRRDERMSFADCALRLRDALDVAVTTRMAESGPVSADFSGGLDSTSIAFLAAGHREEPLPVFAYHHPDAPADDLDHALRNAGSGRNLRLEVVRGTADTLAYQHLSTAVPDGLPDFAVTVRERNRLRLRRIAAAGGRVHLGGEGADALLVAPPAYLGDLAGTGAIGRLLADSRAWARLRHDSPTRVVHRALRLSRTPMRHALREFARQLRRGDARQPGWVDAISWWPAPGLESRWLTAAARRSLADFLDEHAASAEGTARTGAADRTARHDLHRSGTVQRQLGELARPYGVWPQAPFLDNDVIRACTALPAYRRAAGTAFKPLLRAAVHGRVPSAAIARQTKGNYLSEEYRGVRLAAAGLRALLRDSRLADLRLIEPRAVVDSVDRAIAGAGTPFPALNRLIAYDLWLGSLA